MRSILLSILFCLSSAGVIYGQAPAQPPKPTGNSTANPTGYVRPDKTTRHSRYFKSMFSVESLAKYVGVAGFATWRNTPREWGVHWNGFGKRFASNVGKSVIGNTTRYALEEAFKLDSHYYRSTKKNAASRIKNALISPLAARTTAGKLAFGFPSIIGTYTAQIAAVEIWYPKRYGWQAGLRSGTISIGTEMLFNLFREFIHR